MTDLMSLSYNTPQTAAALEHGNFTVFRRNLYANKLNRLPPFKTSGRGEYSYGQIAEMAIHLTAASKHTREMASIVTWGILDRLILAKFHTGEFQVSLNEMSERSAEIEHAQHCPKSLYPALLIPHLIFGGDVISRDPEDRTWALYDTNGAAAGVKPSVSLLQEAGEEPLTMKRVREKALSIATEGASNDRTRELLEPASFIPDLIDLTGVFLRFEGILQMHQEVRNSARRS